MQTDWYLTGGSNVNKVVCVRGAASRPGSCGLTSRMDWLPSGLILKDPVWIIFFGSTWEMAHSISSTRALQAAERRGEDIHQHVSLFCLTVFWFSRDSDTYLHIWRPVPAGLPGCSPRGDSEADRRWARGQLLSSCTYSTDFHRSRRLTHPPATHTNTHTQSLKATRWLN